MKRKKIVLSASGTGGHLFPALRVANKLQDECELLFVAGGLSRSPYFDQSFPFEEVEVATFSSSKKMVEASFKITKGLWQSRKILRSFAPDLVVGFGSYYTLPVVMAASLCGIPLLLHEQNVLPGKVNRLLSRFSTLTAITFPPSAQFLKGNIALTQYPLKESEGEEEPESYFGLEKKPTVLIFGGSQGAQKINEAVCKNIAALQEFQILHFTGKGGDLAKIQSLYESLKIVHVVKEFEPRMDLAMKMASFAICRAGAGTLAELLHYGLPALLIPLASASENHQRENAHFFVQSMGGGKMLLEANLSQLATLLPLDLEMHRKCLAQYKGQQTAKELTELILEL